MKALYIFLAIAGMNLPTFAIAQISLETLRTCLDIEDQTKERLDCYDEKIKPEPKKVSAPAKTAPVHFEAASGFRNIAAA